MLQTTFNQIVAQQRWWQPGANVLVAVSTGADSMALLALLQQLPMALRPTIMVAHVNHQLRAASVTEAAYLQDYCQRHQLPLISRSWPVAGHPQSGVEAAARAFRYAFFKQVMAQHQIGTLLTAHHGDDQFETVLMRLLRGGDLHELAGIYQQRPFANGQLVRPLLAFSKAELRTYCQQHQQPFFDDVTNTDVTLTRNRLRQQVIPRLKQENPAARQHVQQYATQLQALLAVGADYAQQQLVQIGAFHDATYQGDIKLWQALPRYAQALVLRQLCAHFLLPQGLELKTAQIQAGLALLQGSKAVGTVTLAGGWRLQRQYQTFKLLQATAKVPVQPAFTLVPHQWQPLGPTCEIGLFPATSAPAGADSYDVLLAPQALPLIIRHRQPGDRLALKHGQQKVKKILIDQKVPATQRAAVWLATTAQHQLLWVIGYKKAQLFNPAQPDKILYRLVVRTTVS
ncbi:tRNA(Ile)-lysidine synthase [Loigolactobacillus bifermentans DSM 20003]|uniref:tRNA(Ile)-lysidine synthase n=1 Tax=Loigolactobacillus bifermentans DSM 20003 TaxID=1423726 RepID=A0A0R1H2Z7_9LACO|nr:tRNA(Ile)-lysidine synthase [Loigolactobacillus bifermentans DSM 20003]